MSTVGASNSEIFTLPEGTGFLAKYMFFSADRRTGVAQPVEPDPMKYPATARLRGKTLDRNTRRPRTAGPGTSARNPAGVVRPAGAFPAGRTKLPRSDAGPTS